MILLLLIFTQTNALFTIKALSLKLLFYVEKKIRESFSIHFLVMPMALIIFCISVVVLIALILMVVLGLICLLADQNDGVDEDCENIVHL